MLCLQEDDQRAADQASAPAATIEAYWPSAASPGPLAATPSNYAQVLLGKLRLPSPKAAAAFETKVDVQPAVAGPASCLKRFKAALKRKATAKGAPKPTPASLPIQRDDNNATSSKLLALPQRRSLGCWLLSWCGKPAVMGE